MDADDEELRRPGEIRFGGMSFALPPPGDDHVDDHDDGDVDDHDHVDDDDVDHDDDDVDALPFLFGCLTFCLRQEHSQIDQRTMRRRRW